MDTLNYNETGQLLIELLGLKKSGKLSPKNFNYLARLIVAEQLQVEMKSLVEKYLEKNFDKLWKQANIAASEKQVKALNYN